MEWVTCSDPRKESWARLLEYANADIAFDYIARRNGPTADARQRDNYKKQASQVRGALYQAREYFAAADASSLFTSPNHLYYGVSSLASAVMLLRGDGRFSLDYLRKSGANRSHGIDFTTGATAKDCARDAQILDKSFCEILDNGHFINWYGHSPNAIHLSALIKTTSNGLVRSSIGRVASKRVTPISKLESRKSSLTELLIRLPDLSESYRRFGTRIAFTRTVIEKESRSTSDGEPAFEFTYRLFGTPDESCFEEILWAFSIENDLQHLIKCVRGDTGGIVTVGPLKEGQLYVAPEVRVSIEGHTLMYGQSYELTEFGDAYLASFGLSMLSRYFPDLWVTALESHCRASKLAERFIDTYLAKFPMLALGSIQDKDVLFSTHERPQ